MMKDTETMELPGPVDDGLQIERTILAWKRSLLSGSVLLIAAMKVGIQISLAWTIVMVAGAVVVAGSVAIAITRSYRDASRRFRSIDSASSGTASGGGPGIPFGLLGPVWTLMTTITISLCALVLLAAVLVDGPMPR